MNNLSYLFSVLLLTFSSFALADKGPAHMPKDPNCLQVYQACQKAGFVVGEAKEGKGFWMDCVDPVMQGTAAKKSALPLPSVPAEVIQSCKQKHPKFGSGKIGN